MLAPITTLEKPKDFDAFWQNKIENSKQISLDIKWISHESISESVDLKRFTCQGFTHNLLHGYVIYPKHGKNLPCVVTHHGYMYHKGHPSEHMHFVEDGYAVVSYDVRGQSGLSKDDFDYGSGNSKLMTKGIHDPHQYYMVHVYMDAFRIMDLAKHLEFVDSKKLISHGGSQGGGVALAIAALDPKVFLTCADVPSYSYLKGRLATRNGSIGEVSEYVDSGMITQEEALKTLQYIDLIHHAQNIKSPVIASTGGIDMICPEAYFIPTYQSILTEKILYQYPNAGHEGGGSIHLNIKRTWIKEHIREHQQLDQNTHN